MIQQHTWEQSVRFPQGASDFLNNCGERASTLLPGAMQEKVTEAETDRLYDKH